MVRIRKARMIDLSEIVNLDKTIFNNISKFDSDLQNDWIETKAETDYLKNIIKSKKSCIFVAEDKNKLIGYISAVPKIFSYRKSKYIEIDNIGVIPGYRHNGIGKLLINKCLNWARPKGFKRVYATSYFNNKRAIDFYKKYGFTEIDISLEKDIN